MEYATVNYKTPLLASKVGVNYWYFLYFNLHANCVNIAEVAHITSTVRPPRTLNPLAPHSSMPLAALLVSGFTVEAQRREEYSIVVRLSNVTTTVRPAHTPQSARTSQKHAFWQLCLFRHGVHGGNTAEVKCQMYIRSASWRSLHHNKRLTSRIEYGICHY